MSTVERTRTENGAVGRGTARGRLLRAVAAEWVRQASLRSTWWCAAAAVAGMGAAAALLGYSALERITEGEAANPLSYVQLTSQGHYYLVQFAVLTLAALAATGEFGNRSITSTLLWTPRRGTVLAARTLVTAALAFVVGALATVSGVVALAAFIGAHVSVDVPETLATALNAGVCMALFAALFVGLGTALRSTAGTIAVGFLLLMGVPLIMQLSGAQLLDDLAALLPGLAGIEFYAGGDVGFYTAPHDGSVNVAAVVGWAAAAQIVGYTELRNRDV